MSRLQARAGRVCCAVKPAEYASWHGEGRRCVSRNFLREDVLVDYPPNTKCLISLPIAVTSLHFCVDITAIGSDISTSLPSALITKNTTGGLCLVICTVYIIFSTTFKL